MYLNNKVYDVLKWIAQYLLPASAALYYTLSSVWNLPYSEEVVGSIVAVDVFLGVILGISTSRYNNAKIREGYMSSTAMSETSEVVKVQSAWALSEKTYDILKWVTMIVLPAGGTLYFALSQLWGFPYGQEIVGTIAALTAFSGLLLGVSTNQFKKL